MTRADAGHFEPHARRSHEKGTELMTAALRSHITRIASTTAMSVCLVLLLAGCAGKQQVTIDQVEQMLAGMGHAKPKTARKTIIRPERFKFTKYEAVIERGDTPNLTGPVVSRSRPAFTQYEYQVGVFHASVEEGGRFIFFVEHKDSDELDALLQKIDQRMPAALTELLASTDNDTDDDFELFRTFDGVDVGVTKRGCYIASHKRPYWMDNYLNLYTFGIPYNDKYNDR